MPKGSGYVNVIELSKDLNGTTSMDNTRKIDLIHKPRSGDAYNKKYNIVLMAAANRPMGSFIDVESDEVVGTIGEDVDCTLTDGSQLLSHADVNTVAAATKYHCALDDHGGDQITGHPYWLTEDYAAIVDRANRQISTYFVWHDGTQLRSRLVNHLPTNTSVHQIVPRDRTALPRTQQEDFYAVEEGKDVGNIGNSQTDADYAIGKPHALIHMKLTSNGLQLERRINLQRTQVLPKAKSDRILTACLANFRNTNNYRQGRSLTQAYLDLFNAEGIELNPDQNPGVDFPVECFYPGIPGGHNADFAPNNRHLYVPMAGGAMSIIDVNRWKIVNSIDIGPRTGPGHVCFSAKHNIALVTNHATNYIRLIRNINSERPTRSQLLGIEFHRPPYNADIRQSHTCYIDEAEDYYYNYWLESGVFFKMDLAKTAANTRQGNIVSSPLMVATLETGGVPIQGSYIDMDDIRTNTPQVGNAICEAGVDPQVIRQGEGTALWWWSDEVTTASINQGVGSVNIPSDYKWLFPTETTTYTMTAQGENGAETTCNATVVVEGQIEQNPPVCELGADPQNIRLGEGSALWWWSDNLSSAMIDNGIGSVTVPSDYTWFYPTQTRTYIMTGRSATGLETSCQTTIVVN